VDRIKLLEELWAVVDAPPGVDVAKYSQVEYFAIRHKLATY